MAIEIKVPNSLVRDTKIKGNSIHTGLRADILEWLETTGLKYQAWLYPESHWGDTSYTVAIEFEKEGDAMLFKLTWM